MALIITVATTIWLVICALLLGFPIILSLDSLGYTLGVVWGLFASSWALLYLIEPDSSSFSSFCQILQIHLSGAPALYTCHMLYLVSLLYWARTLFQGLQCRTMGYLRVAIRIGGFLILLCYWCFFFVVS